MAYKKSIHGDENQQNEIASHNKIHFSDSGSLQIVTIFACLLIVSSFFFMSLFQAALLQVLITVTFIGIFALVWILALSFTIRHVSTTTAQVAIDKSGRSQAQREARLLHAGEHYAIFEDENGSIQFRGTTILTENRQFLPQAVAAPDQQELILTCYDQGMSGRAIEKWLKDRGDKKTTYHQIQKTLNLYRPEWNKKTVESGQPEDEFPV